MITSPVIGWDRLAPVGGCGLGLTRLGLFSLRPGRQGAFGVLRIASLTPDNRSSDQRRAGIG